MSYFDTVLLYCLKQISGERTIYSVYHLFKGKKSSQTIQDAHLFDLTKFFGVYQWVTREKLEDAIKYACMQNWLTPSSEQRFILTDMGKNHLQHSKNEFSDLPYLNGWKYHQRDLKFWERLSLLVQVISNLVSHEVHYIPIQKNKQTHMWLKAFLQNSQMPRDKLGGKLYSELVACLEDELHVNPALLILRLTGFDRIGLTSEQTAEKMKLELPRYQLEFLNILHYLMMKVSDSSSNYPLLSSIAGNQEQGNILTKSAYTTFQLIKNGVSIEETAKFRHLKTNTIEDHIVEIALNMDDFSIDEYIEEQLQQKILSAARKTESRKLKQIKEMVYEANYFEIRLVLARYGVKQWN